MLIIFSLKTIEVIKNIPQFSCSVLSDSLQPHGRSMPGFSDCLPCQVTCITNSQSLLKLMSIELVMPFNHLILCHPLLFLSSIFSRISPSMNWSFPMRQVLCNRWPKYWSFSFSISPYNVYSGLISFRIDWFNLLAVQGTQQSSPTPQFKTINSLVLSFLYGPTLTSIHD